MKVKNKITKHGYWGIIFSCQLMVLLLIMFPNDNSFAQTDTTGRAEKKSYLKAIAIPTGACLTSALLMIDSTKYNLQKSVRSIVKDDFRTHVDDYIQYAPTAMMYTADLFKVPSKNTVWNQTKFLIMSQALTAGLVHLGKAGFAIERPDKSSNTAYPSGHTAQSFVESQVLYQEFRHTAPWLAYTGHAISFSVAGLRVLNNRHWVPDVFLGAGIALLVTNTIYYFEPLKNWNPFEKWRTKKNRAQLRFMPQIGQDNWGASFRLRF